MELRTWIQENHTLFNLVCGPIVMWLVWKIPKVHWSMKVGLTFIGILLAVGVVGLFDNLWYLPIVLIVVSWRNGIALNPIRYLLLTSGILLIVAAIAFVIYACYQKPGNILQFLFNPLSFVYFIPGVVCISFANMAAERIAEGKAVKDAMNENRNN
jgi:hypothetical protein